MDLSETALGCASLSALLADTKFSGICTVVLRERGYVVVPIANEEPDSGKRPVPVEPDVADEGTPTGSPVSHPPTPPESPANSRPDGTPTSAKGPPKRPPPELMSDDEGVDGYIPMPTPTPVGLWTYGQHFGFPLPGEARPSERPPPWVSPLAPLAGEAGSSRPAAPPPPPPPAPAGYRGDKFAISPQPPPAPLESPHFDSQVERGSELNLDSSQVPDAQSTQHSESPVPTPSRRPTPKGAFDHRLQHVDLSLLSRTLLTLLGSRVNPELR